MVQQVDVVGAQSDVLESEETFLISDYDQNILYPDSEFARLVVPGLICNNHVWLIHHLVVL